MRKLVIFMHTSLDGFVAGTGSEMDWIKVDAEIFELAGKQTDRSDLALYGRITYEMMDSYWPTAADKPGASTHDIQHSHWYNSVEKVVVSKSWEGKSLPHVHIISDHLKEEVTKLKETGEKDIVVFGSPGTVHSLLRADLVDEFWLFINPVLLGEGVPLFKNIREVKRLELLSSKVFANGVVALHYCRASEQG